VKKITAIFFLSLYLFSATGVRELLKINVLVQHFYETKKKDNTITFFNFLVMHYITGDLNDKDNSRDNQLPFKSTETCLLNASLTYIPGQYISPLALPSFAINKRDFSRVKELFIFTKCPILVWHPPKYS
jgi:hypothetical protein